MLKLKNKIQLLSYLFIIPFSLIACSDSKTIDEEKKDVEYIRIVDKGINVERGGEEKIVEIETNIDTKLIQVEVLENTSEWCQASLNGTKLKIVVGINPLLEKRKTTVKLEYNNIRQSVNITQEGKNTSLEGLKDDIKIKILDGTASSFQGGQGIDKSFDGDLSTLYHSKWGQPNNFPITLIYKLKTENTLDYIIYNPRLSNSGSNGNFKEVEIWVTSEKGKVKAGDYDFEGRSVSTRIDMPQSYINVSEVEFIIKSGIAGFAACSEMEFYAKNPDNFDYRSIFEDLTCTTLKTTATPTEIAKMTNTFYKELAYDIYNKLYDFEFRVEEYKPYQHPDVQAGENKTNPYNKLDNPTGIHIDVNGELIVFADKMYGERVSILIQNLTKGYGGVSYQLVEGYNKINVGPNSGLIYVMYHTSNTNAKPVKIHFATGKVNGYFDSQKHKSEDWQRILKKANYFDFDVLGKYAHLTFPTSKFKANTPDGLKLINAYDDLVYLEQVFLGLEKYNKMFTNRMYFVIDYNSDGYMYATSYRTAYVLGTIDALTSVDNLRKTPWGPAHEVGHMNQTRPGLKWQGMTEVTNNIYSLHVQTSWGNKSRLIADNRYSKGFKLMENQGEKLTHVTIDDVFVRLIPFWQLKLYLMDILGQKDFYKDMHEYYRTTPNLNASSTTQGVYQLLFVEKVCEYANLDLLDFFQKWGFLTAVDTEVDDYGKAQFRITDNQINELKTKIKNKNYPKPKHKDIHLITDENLSQYK